jgi:hypothetical protein
MVEHLLCKCEALSPNPSPTKRKKERKKDRKKERKKEKLIEVPILGNYLL